MMRSVCISQRGPFIALALVAAWAFSPGCHYLNYNFRAVEPGGFYRSGQMPADHFQYTVEKNRVQTVINLRGADPGEKWFEEEKAAAEACGADYHVMGWSMKRLPEPESLLEFVRLLETAERPILAHCQGGTHRGGVAAAIFRLNRGESVEAAREELDLFFNDAPIGGVLDLYEGSDLRFREWVETEYPALYAGHPDGGALAG